MATRRQEKVSRLVKEVVSEAIMNDLGDPRIEGLISVTMVEMAPNLRNAEVYLSILSKNEASQNKTFAAITHARTRIQSLLGKRITSKFCPILHFHIDEKFKKTLDIMNLIDRAVAEGKAEDPIDQPED